MISLSKQKAVVGIDLEAGSIAATEVHMNGTAKLARSGVLPLPAGVVHEGEVGDPAQLSASLKQLFTENKLAKEVRLGIANQRVVVRTLRFPLIEKKSELEAAVRFQAQEHIPMPLEQAVLDYEVVGRSGAESGEATMDVVVVAARREMVSPLISAMRKAGLRPVGIDLSAFGMIRALATQASVLAPEAVPSYEERMAGSADAPGDAPISAALYCNLGDVTNLAIARGRTCLFTRVSSFGIEGIAQRLAERRELSLDHARQWLTHVGLTAPVGEVEGDPSTVAAAREALNEGASRLVDEIRLSLEYYAAQEGMVAVETVIACGAGTTIPGLVEQIERELGKRVIAPVPEGLGHLDAASAARLTLSYGLASEL